MAGAEGRGRRHGALAVALIVLLGAGRAHAQTTPPPSAPPDTSLDQFLNGMSDSTSTYFGKSAAPVDTAGLDSALADALLKHPRYRRHELPVGFSGNFDFNRADGPVYTSGLHLGTERGLGELSGETGYAAGPNLWLYRIGYEKHWGPADNPWRVELAQALETWTLDRDGRTPRITTWGAFMFGRDGQNYLRRRGWSLAASKTLGRFDLAAGYRDMLETALDPTATWNLFNRKLERYDNLPAMPGRVHEISLAGGVALWRFPARLEAFHQIAARDLGSDLEYRRTRVAASAEFPLSRWMSLVPQASWGELTRTAVPQQSFYLGGTPTLRSLPYATEAGTGMAAGRLELIGTRDFLAQLHLPHPGWLPLQLGAFAGSAGVWGTDPYGGPRPAGGSWPESNAWRSEVGFSLINQPGIPDPTAMVRFNCAWRVGDGAGRPRFTVEYSKALGFASVLTGFGGGITP